MRGTIGHRLATRVLPAELRELSGSSSYLQGEASFAKDSLCNDQSLVTSRRGGGGPPRSRDARGQRPRLTLGGPGTTTGAHIPGLGLEAPRWREGPSLEVLGSRTRPRGRPRGSPRRPAPDRKALQLRADDGFGGGIRKRPGSGRMGVAGRGRKSSDQGSARRSCRVNVQKRQVTVRYQSDNVLHDSTTRKD